MSEKLRSTLIQIKQLLHDCGRRDDAEMISSAISRLECKSMSTAEYQDLLDELKKFMHPRGAFYDSGLVPAKGSNLSKDEAYIMQSRLANEFWSEVEG